MMGFNVHERVYATHPFCFSDNHFDAKDIKKIRKYCDRFELGTAKVGVDSVGQENTNIRQSRIKFFNPNDNNGWIFQKIRDGIQHLNDNYYGFDLVGFDHIQYTEYNNSGSKYDFHMDMFTGINGDKNLTRKLSGVLFLSDPEEFTGGEFQIMEGGPDYITTIQQKAGRLIVFPSYMIHRVAPVSSGVRRSLVVWCVGPKFK